MSCLRQANLQLFLERRPPASSIDFSSAPGQIVLSNIETRHYLHAIRACDSSASQLASISSAAGHSGIERPVIAPAPDKRHTLASC